MGFLFTSESVSSGHPDKIADRISDAILDNLLAFDKDTKAGCETMVTTNQVILAGETTSKANIDYDKLVRSTIGHIGYDNPEYLFDNVNVKITNLIHGQSPDIYQGVVRGTLEDQGAGDQGIMFGYATNETEDYMPLPLHVCNKILEKIEDVRKHCNSMPYLRPDAKAQVTVEYDDDGIPVAIKTILVSVQHDDFIEKTDEEVRSLIEADIRNIIMPCVIGDESDMCIKQLLMECAEYIVNPTGRFVIGGPHGDAGLTGRKIIVDTYGGFGAHGGGAFSGKDPSKVDRSAAYALRHIAKNLVAAGICDKCLLQVGYAIGMEYPVSLYVNTYGTGHVNISDNEIAKIINDNVDLRPGIIIRDLKLAEPIYEETSSYGHFGRHPLLKQKVFTDSTGEILIKYVELFTWEKLDYVDKFKGLFAKYMK